MSVTQKRPFQGQVANDTDIIHGQDFSTGQSLCGIPFDECWSNPNPLEITCLDCINELTNQEVFG